MEASDTTDQQRFAYEYASINPSSNIDSFSDLNFFPWDLELLQELIDDLQHGTVVEHSRPEPEEQVIEEFLKNINLKKLSKELSLVTVCFYFKRITGLCTLESLKNFYDQLFNTRSKTTFVNELADVYWSILTHYQSPNNNFERRLVSEFQCLHADIGIEHIDKQQIVDILDQAVQSIETTLSKSLVLTLIVQRAVNILDSIKPGYLAKYRDEVSCKVEFGSSIDDFSGVDIAVATKCRLAMSVIQEELKINCRKSMKMVVLIGSAIFTRKGYAYSNGKNSSKFQRVIDPMFHLITGAPVRPPTRTQGTTANH